MTTEFRHGDRVRISAQGMEILAGPDGKVNPVWVGRRGVVTRTPTVSTRKTVEVLFDDRRRPTHVHRAVIEKEPAVQKPLSERKAG